MTYVICPFLQVKNKHKKKKGNNKNNKKKTNRRTKKIEEEEEEQPQTTYKFPFHHSKALISNTRGRLTFSMDGVMCRPGANDPCEKYRPNCTASDYCAVGWYTETLVKRLWVKKRPLGDHGF